jgi:type I restriction enzyme S subunit
MNADTLLENFEILAEAPGGIDRLRELLLHLGVSGKLLPQISAEVREEILWSVDSLRLDEHRLWGESYLENTPATWPKVPLARLGSWGSGGTPTRGNKTYYDGEIPWLVIGDLNDGVVTRAANSITKKGLEESSAVIVPVGAVFVAMYGSIGKSGIAGIECATNQAIAHCVPDRKVISTEYLFLIIRAVKPRLFSQGRGLAQQNISQTVLKHLMISVPPLAEQNRIVAKVDELMALCDQLEAGIKARGELAEKFARSVMRTV